MAKNKQLMDLKDQFNPTITPKMILSSPIHFLAFGGGLGLMPQAPGTFGSLPGLVLFALACFYQIQPLVIGGLILFLFVAGVWICGLSARRLGVHDHGGIVFDEIVGMMITCLPIFFIQPTGEVWSWYLAAFLFFRFFDILKPFPIKILDHRVPGGLGIMIDDVLAGIYGAIALGLCLHFCALYSLG